MDNYAIADQLALLSKLMDIHGENAFKAKSYASAAFTIEKLPTPLASMAKGKINTLRGIGESVGAKVVELLETGELDALKSLVKSTPAGVLEMMNIKGLGPKKIHTIWKELDIATIKELEQACQENKIAAKKGFGEKTQQKILESIQFKEQTSGSYLYAQVEPFAEAFLKKLEEEFGDETIEITGDFKRQLEVIDKLEWVTTVKKGALKKYLLQSGFNLVSESDERITVEAEEMLTMIFHLAKKEDFSQVLFESSSSPEFLKAWQSIIREPLEGAKSEKELFKKAGIAFIPAYMRETVSNITQAKEKEIPAVLQTADIKGLIHAHSDWSDGAHTIEEMAEALIASGFEYLVISDHSKAAYYAGGLTEQKIKEQHRYIDTLNKKLTPFRIFKSIECDILSDGSLDYTDKILSSFDLVIVSIHSNLQMTQDKAMMRLRSAVENKYTSIVGHMTGRRLLKRPAYSVDHQEIIDLCAEHNVVIEINANPQRLDMKWEWVSYAMDKGLMLSINPDAHTIDEFKNIKYGVLTAQKGGLTKERNLSSFSLEEFEAFVAEQKRKRD
jgi:DNA polymerase (family 10)